MSKNIGVDPDMMSGLQSTLNERLWAAYKRNDRRIFDQLTAFLKATPERRELFTEGRKFGEESSITIDRSKPFDPVELLGEGWSIVEQDERSLAITELRFEDVELVTPLFREGEKEKEIRGHENLKRLKKDGRIRLDAQVCLALLDNPTFIPLSWREKPGKFKYISFDGTILRGPKGRYNGNLYLTWSESNSFTGNGKWMFDCEALYHGVGNSRHSAVLTMGSTIK